MPKILITGNGFDINIELPTKYAQMMDAFEKLYLSGDGSRIEIDPIENDGKLQREVLIKKKLLSNKFYHFFKSEYDIETWIDFENKIEFLLGNIYEGVTLFQKEYFSSGDISVVSFKDVDIADITSKRDVVKTLLLYGIINKTKSNDIEIYELNNRFLIERDKYYSGFNYKEIGEYLLKELNDFVEIFVEYFRLFVIPQIDDKIKNKYVGWFNKIDKHYTFNYTPTFEILTNNKKTTKYLHGKITQEEKNIVLGVDELPFNGEYDKYFIPFKKVYQSLFLNTDYTFLSDYNIKSEEYFKFYIIGHSLDMSDAYYIEELISFVNEVENDSRQLFVVYHDEEARGKQLVNLFKIIGENKILKLAKEKKLVLLELNSEELKTELTTPLDETYSEIGRKQARKFI
jgi:hypothetical protein